jgi:ketosteroid isomerase-like protein
MITAKEAALNVWQAFASRDADRIRAAFTPDARWLAPPGNATAIASGADAESLLTVDGIVAFITGAYNRIFPEGAAVEILKVIGEGDTAVIEQIFRARVANGRMYENRYCWVFIARDGKICEMREYMDTHTGFAAIFGDELPRRLVN